jgi:hypothetical protein
VSRREYWFEFFQGDKRLGVGFFLTRCYALTPLHCLPGITINDFVDICFASGEKVQGRVHRHSREADLALIDIPPVDNTAVILPNFGRADEGGSWRNPYRPSADHIFLTGKVTEFAIEYRCVGGGEIEAIQLECDQPVGNYAGYSGSPVELKQPGGDKRVIGILLEQYPDQYQDYKEFQRASNVLFAATLAEAYRRFDCFDTGYLISVLRPLLSDQSTGSAVYARRKDGPDGVPGTADGSIHSTHRSKSSPKKIARKKLETLRDFQKRGLVDEQDVVSFRREIIRRFVENEDG